MPLIQKSTLKAQLSVVLNDTLVDLLVDEFVSMERRFIQRDWEPASLDGGQFAEIAARLLYHKDSGNLNLSKPFSECCRYIDNEDAHVQHGIVPRDDGRHLVHVLRVVYKFRSQRGAVHISPTYKPNHMDSKFLIESVRWLFNEIIRMYWAGDAESAAVAIREILKFDVPCIGQYEDILLVQRTDLSNEEELLVLLHYAGETGFSRTALGRHSHASPSSVTTILQRLCSAAYRQVVFTGGCYKLTELGSKRMRDTLTDKLLLQ
jgi:hypothetical protein